MKETRRFLHHFSLYDRLEIEACLEEKAREGWLLDKMSSGTWWRYRPIDPQRLTFSVVYRPERVEDLTPEARQTFLDFCAHDGWTLADSRGFLYIFYSDQADPTPIETERGMEIEQIHAASKKGYLAENGRTIGFTLLCLVGFGVAAWRDPIGFLASNSRLFLMAVWTITLLFGITELVSYLRWYRRARQAAEWGEFLPFQSERKLSRIHSCVAVVVLALGFAVFYQRGMWPYLGLVVLGVAALAVMLYSLSKSADRDREAGGGGEKAAGVAAGVLAVVMLGMIFLFIALDSQEPQIQTSPEGEVIYVYTIGGDMESDDRGDLSVTLEDLTDTGGRATSCHLTREHSLLLTRERAHQETTGDPNGPQLDYTLVQVDTPLLDSPCRSQLRQEQEGGTYQETDPSPWSAQEAWQLSSGQGQSTYLLCWEGRLAELTTTWPLTAEQMRVVGEKLGGV